jgi:Flp pilus assembly protein TadD
MKVQRLLLIPEVLWFGRFLTSLVIFFWMWIRSRRLMRLVIATPAIALTIAFAWAVIVSHLRSRDPALLEHYLSLARQAVGESELKDARLLFRRAQQLAPGDQNITMELASSLFQLNERSEAYQLLGSIAPVQKSGHLPAHRFLAENPPELSPVQQDRFRAIHLSHLVRNSAETRQERIQLLQMLARYRKFDDVEKLIREALDRYPEDRLFLAQLKAREGDQPGARLETEQACEALTAIVAKEPRNADRRIQLAQGLVFLSRFADAICVMSEGMTDTQSAGFVLSTTDSVEGDSTYGDVVRDSNDRGELEKTRQNDVGQNDVGQNDVGQNDVGQNDEERERKLALTLSNTYFAWMKTLPLDERAMQLRCLERMLTQNAQQSSSTDKPADLNARMQSALQDPAMSWVRAAVEGNARAARGELSDAANAYRLALQAAPNDPTLSNNLAWVLLTQSRAQKADSPEQVQQQLLTEALRWSEQAVQEMPEIVSFLETRGQIQAALGNHAQAISDLAACLDRGKDSPEIQRTMEACARALR